MRTLKPSLVLAWLGLAAALAAPTTEAQQQTGNLLGRVVDSQGKPMAGVTVTLGSQGPPQVKTTGEDGGFRFLGLAPGLYQVLAERENFTSLEHRNLNVQVSRNLELEIKLLNVFEVASAQQVEDSVVVTAESPILDTRMVTKGLNVPREELEKLPINRDPWAILQQTPGVILDRINVAGSEGARQAKVVSPGTDPRNTVWQVDGVAITDMVGSGASSTYYDFDTFEAIEVSVGGADASLATAGATVNLVTKRATNQWRFSTRFFHADDDWQADLSLTPGELGGPGPWNRDTQQETFRQGNRIVTTEDYGIEGGGPLIKEHLWGWASWGQQEIDLLTISDYPDNSDIENRSVKLSTQFSPNSSGSFYYHFSDLIRLGQDAGPFRPPETSVDRRSPTPIYKLEQSQLFGKDFYLTANVSQVESQFDLLPQGGGIGDPNAPSVVIGPDGGWRNSFLAYQTERPQSQIKLEGNYFFPTGNVNHELRFGTGYRRTDIESTSAWPGLQAVGFANQEIAEDVYFGFITSGSNYRDRVEATHVYLQDTLAFGDLTANVGLRYDLQRGKNKAITLDPAPITGGVLVGGSFPESDAGFEWESVTPRLGLTYALGKEDKTLLRASYAHFADQLDDNGIYTTSPGNAQYGYFYWYDYNADLDLTRDEVGPFFSFIGVDPDFPTRGTVNAVDPDIKAPTTQELTFAVEHALRPELVLGLSLTARRYTDIEDQERLIVDPDAPPGSIGRPHRRDDYEVGWIVEGSLPDGTAFSVPVYRLRPELTTFGGVYRENGDREQDYLGVSLTAHKRLSNQWLLRGHATWSDWQWSVPDSEREDPTLLLPGDTIDGSPVVIGSASTQGVRGNVFVNSGWSYDLSALYQIAPEKHWGFNVAANLFGREGFPVPYNVPVNPRRDPLARRQVLLGNDLDEYRLSDVHLLSARIDKEIKIKDSRLTLSLEAFNLTNESYVLQRASAVSALQTDVRTGEVTDIRALGGNWVVEVLPPRILRLGARFSFR